MIITFLDAGVLIAAARGKPEIADKAYAIIDDPNRSFAASEYVRLEVLPKALFNKRNEEASFYEEFFRSVSYWPDDTETVVKDAYGQGVEHGLAAMDSLHVAAAIAVGADELVTTEKPSKPLHRTTDMEVRSIHTDAGR